MFSGNSSMSFSSSKPMAEVIKVVEDQLEVLGMPSISSSGGITVNGSRFNGFSYTPSIEGRISNREGKYSVTLDFQAKPDIMGWAIAICAFPIGVAVFILPNNAKSDMQRKADMALAEIKAILDESRYGV
jgi:hypothetical protein